MTDQTSTDETPTFTRCPTALDDVATQREFLDDVMRGAQPWQIKIALPGLLNYQVGNLFGLYSDDSIRGLLIRIAATAINWVELIDRTTEAPPLTPTEQAIVAEFGIHS